MVALAELVRYADELLRVREFADYCPNGLQVEGRAQVRRVVSGVTASQVLIEAAVAAGADVLLVHHGYFWKGEDPRLVGMKGRRIGALFAAGISLLAYHLPLDAHPELGNNAQLARRLGLSIDGVVDDGSRMPLILRGQLPRAFTPAALADHIGDALGRAPVHVAGGPDRIRTVAWCTGAGQRFIDAAADAGVDAFISGEISEPTAHVARERGIHYFAAGHHATERDGVRALGERLAAEFGLEHRFVDLDNPA